MQILGHFSRDVHKFAPTERRGLSQLERAKDLFEGNQVFKGTVGRGSAEEGPARAVSHNEQASVNKGPAQHPGSVKLAQVPISGRIEDLSLIHI